jgi:phospholipase/carboxylesterase
MSTTQGSGHHAGQPIIAAGEPLERARAAMVMVHGRGASAPDMLSLAGEFSAEGMAFLAPQAASNTWYPYSFLEPMERNEPYLSSALAQLVWLVEAIESAGVPAERVILLGFSQGACLSTEYAARNARRYGGVAGLSGGLIGPPGTPRDYAGSMGGTPVFLGCSDVDFHIPIERVLETAEVFRELGADVTDRIYPGMGHTIIRDEVEHVQRIIDQLEAS